MISKSLLFIIWLYQYFISPFLPARCRYYPTCSEYAKVALQWHGSKKGSILAYKRLCRCHPLGGQGIDFVPLPLYQYNFQPLFNTNRITTASLVSNMAHNAIVKRDILQPPVLHLTYGAHLNVFRDKTSYTFFLNQTLKAKG